jgi:hypothetical protein
MRSACACIRAGVFVRSCELPWVTARACSVPFHAFHTSVVSVVSGLGQITQVGSVSTGTYMSDSLDISQIFMSAFSHYSSRL